MTLRIVRAPNAVTIALDCAAWAALSFGVGYVAHRAPVARFGRDGVVTRLRPFEADGRWYERTARIGSWKRRIPEAGDFFPGGFSKANLVVRDSDHLERYVAETRRAELTHWALAASGPLFVLWNPPGVAAAHVGYGLVANLPCIAIQRYNRARLLRVLERRRRREAREARSPQCASSMR